MTAAAIPDPLPDLRRRIAAIGSDGGVRALAAAPVPVPLGHAGVDRALGGGLLRTGLHELQPATPGDAGAATGFALACAARLAGPRPWLWVRQDQAGREAGEPYGPGLAALGLAPEALTLVAARDAAGVLRAAEEGLRCRGLGAVLAEPWGDPRALDMTALRRLVLAAEAGVPALLLRSGGHGGPSGALTRWTLAAAPGAPQPARGIGLPAVVATLSRCRQPGAGGGGILSWTLEWNPDERLFREPAPARPGAAAAGDRPAATAAGLRHAG